MIRYVKGARGSPLEVHEGREYGVRLAVRPAYFPGEACQCCVRRPALVAVLAYNDTALLFSLEVCGQCSRKFQSSLDAKTEHRQRIYNRYLIADGNRWLPRKCEWETPAQRRNK